MKYDILLTLCVVLIKCITRQARMICMSCLFNKCQLNLKLIYVKLHLPEWEAP